ncbi:MAG: aldo/keto reductase [Bacteroidales bacterium]|nr:aldo/keto reductase [Bacteroidales bacterium]MBO7480241.1 aldo/keto reductase [Bacteroidales bacterium]MBO7487184.1 aldo/keto reductase [Bacteroidales bacterium]
MNLLLPTGFPIPTPGFGTYKTPDGEVCVNAVREAIAVGYTHIDTAALYANECSVGEGVRQSGRPRGELFITSKVWNTERGYDKTLRACEKSLKDLGMDYLDLYLIHWPANAKQFGDRADAINVDTWRAMERLVEERVVRTIGLSNFYTSHMAPVLASANIAPAVDQIEYHPGLLQEDTIAACRENGILVEAWSPLGRGRLLDDPVIAGIAQKHGKSAAQVILRWVIQNDVLPLVKSVHTERIRENFDLFSFSLDSDEMAAIASLPEARFGSHPDTVEF